MKKNFISFITACALYMAAISVSCSKNDTVLPTPIPPSHSPDTAIQPIETDTIQVEDYQWEISASGYRSDLRPFVNGRTIVDLFVSYNGTQTRVSPGKTIDFYGGYLLNSGSQLTFYASYNERPFRSLGLTMIVNE